MLLRMVPVCDDALAIKHRAVLIDSHLMGVHRVTAPNVVRRSKRGHVDSVGWDLKQGANYIIHH